MNFLWSNRRLRQVKFNSTYSAASISPASLTWLVKLEALNIINYSLPIETESGNNQSNNDASFGATNFVPSDRIRTNHPITKANRTRR